MAAEDHFPARSREAKVAGDCDSNTVSAAVPSQSATTTTTTMQTQDRNSSFLRSPLESLLLVVYPAILIFGTLFSVLSPETRNAPFDVARQSHVPAHAPSYFARKDNLFNVIFVKRGWLWITAAFFTFVATHPTFRNKGMALRAATRWALITGWWILVTQWCFGPPLVDRGFRFTGGKCQVAHEAMAEDQREYVSSATCRTAGGSWSGGHDISGHVFLLVLGSCFLVQEVVCAVVMGDGAIKGAGAGSGRTAATHEKHLGVGGKFSLGVVALSLWMLLMTAVYFHTWFEKFTGLLVASIALHAVYKSPLRRLVGLPGI